MKAKICRRIPEMDEMGGPYHQETRKCELCKEKKLCISTFVENNWCWCCDDCWWKEVQKFNKPLPVRKPKRKKKI